jgi:23S rRNA (pseudouridine1915-N3)-methyltransferase
MKQFTLICVGKVKEPFCRDGIGEFSKRLSKEFEIIAIKESTKEREAVEILRLVDSFDFVVALDEHGSELTSLKFSQLLKKHQEKKIVFVIGNADGLDSSVMQNADLVMALSQMTLTHEMAQLLFVEQLYRALSILAGKSYHRV